MDGARDGQAVLEQGLVDRAVGPAGFPHHVGGDLVLEAVHAFVEVADERAVTTPGRFAGASLGPGAHEQAGLAGHGVPPATLNRALVAKRADVGAEVVLPEGFERRSALGFGNDSRQVQGPGEALAEDLVDVAALVGVRALEVGRNVNEILAVINRGKKALTAAFGPLLAALRKGDVACLAGHLSASGQGRQVQRADPAHRPFPGGVERVVLHAFEQAVGISGPPP